MGQRTVAWRALGGLLVSSILLFVILTWVSIASADAHEKALSTYRTATVSIQGTPTPDATTTELQKEKLRQEVDQLKNQSLCPAVARPVRPTGY
jgi:hypothetical protein